MPCPALPSLPPALPAVAASNAVDDLYGQSLEGSNYGKQSVTLAAPGVFLPTTDYINSTAYWLFSGTSGATPVVAGAIALMYSAAPDAPYQVIV